MLESQFGKYRIEGVAGVGGMSVVYRAFDESLSRIIALKILNAQRAADEISLRRFQREAEIAQRLKHPHIVTIYESGKIGDQAYLAMEYLPEGSLALRFSKPVPMTLGTAATLLGEIASALDYAHANGVVHRDLKLENVLINEAGHFVLSDFGIAQLLDVSSLTETGQTFGTPLYVSPEQVRGAKSVDFRTDLYSLGVIAYLLATGYFPFSGNSGVGILHSHLTQEPPLPSNLNPRLPPEMDWVLLKGLSKRPQDRFASAGAQAEAFAAAITHVAEVEIVILASQPTPILSQSDAPTGKRAGNAGGADTVPIGDLIASKPPRRSSSPTPFRVAVGLVLLAFISIVLLGLGRVLTPPPDGIATQPVTPNVALVETQSTSTNTPTMTATASSTRTIPPTNTRRPSLTPITPTGSATAALQVLLGSASPSPTRRSTGSPPLLVSPVPTQVPGTFATPTASPSETRQATQAASLPATHVATAAPTSAPTHMAATSIQPTSIPPTQVPPTSIPPTAVPPTQVPPTPLPPTPVPPTPVPPTQVPPTQPPPPTATGVLDPILPPIVPTLVCGLLC